MAGHALPPRDARGRFMKARPRRRAARAAPAPRPSPVRYPDAWYGDWYRRVLLWIQHSLWGDHEQR